MHALKMPKKLMSAIGNSPYNSDSVAALILSKDTVKTQPNGLRYNFLLLPFCVLLD